MTNKIRSEQQEPYVTRPFVQFLEAAIEAEMVNDPVSLGNLAEMGITIGSILLKKEEGEAIRILKKERIAAQLKIFHHYASIIGSEKIENMDFRTLKITERDYVKNEVSRIIDRYIIRICTYSFRRAPLKLVSVDNDFESQLFFDIKTIVEDARQELNDIMKLYGVGA
jgi:hypothetical protein